MVFYAASNDTDKNGVIDLSDLRSLYVYSLHTEKMRVIADAGNQVANYSFIENSKNLLVEFQLSQYKENLFEYAGSPKKILKYDFEAQRLISIIPEAIQKEMQKLVEGK